MSATASQSPAETRSVKAGLIEFEVIPLGPFVNWEMHFATNDR